MNADEFFRSAELERWTVDDAAIGVRRYGRGPALLFFHGFPVHGWTWRRLLPALAERFTCFVLDLPGLGDSDWSDTTDFRFTAQAHRIATLTEKLPMDRFSLIAHDTGATIARLVALETQGRTAKLALMNTEIPGHRPPWIPLYQKLSRMPGSGATFRRLLQSQLFVRSSLGLGEFFSDAARFDDPGALTAYIDPLARSSRKTRGMLHYLRGIEWDVVDSLRTRHAEITAPVLLLWGEDDHTFPADRAEPMTAQFGGEARFVRIRGASLMPQEERPEIVLTHLLPFLERP